MSSRFIDVADKVFEEVDDILDLLPLRVVSRHVKHYADRRICQVILRKATASKYDKPVMGGVGIIKLLRLDIQKGEPHVGGEVPVSAGVDGEGSINKSAASHPVKEGMTYGDVSRLWSWNKFCQQDCRRAELDLVASQVLIDLDQNCRIRFVPRIESWLEFRSLPSIIL
jgi:hypothetical protein